MVVLKEVVSKPVQNILPPEITNKENIKTSTFNNDSSKEENSYYKNPVTRKLSVKNEKGNKSKYFAFYLYFCHENINL